MSNGATPQTMTSRSKCAASPFAHVASVEKPRNGEHPRLYTMSQREAPEDPFNLVGFFPSHPAESRKQWDWIYWHKDDVDNEDDDAGTHHDFSVPSMPRKHQRDQSYDEIACEVIEEEDKYGMLAFSSKKFSSLLPWKMPMFGRTMLPEHVEPSSVDEPIDVETLHSKHCRRRETVIEQDAEHGLEIGPLFFSGEEEMKIDMSWGKTILSRLESLVGEL